jgi:hypothetical protein
MATTGICNSWKVELMQAGHCFNAVLTQTASMHTNDTVDGMASTAGIAVGMAVTGTSIAANTVVASITSATAIKVYPNATGTTTNSVTFTGDAFKIALIKVSPARVFDNTQTNIGTPGSGTPSATNLGTDEVVGTGYVSGGFALTNVNPSLPGNPTTTATTSFSPNPSWTSATISTTAAIIYNNSTRVGAAAAPLNGRTVSVHDFGGTQTVTSGTLTLVMPTNDGSNAIIRIA